MTWVLNKNKNWGRFRSKIFRWNSSASTITGKSICSNSAKFTIDFRSEEKQQSNERRIPKRYKNLYILPRSFDLGPDGKEWRLKLPAEMNFSFPVRNPARPVEITFGRTFRKWFTGLYLSISSNQTRVLVENNKH